MGMLLRDYFAAQALIGMTANPHTVGNYVVLAESAYKYADAMIAAREPK